eukprot:CAMPEP_0168371078 /NCGR_PEP_ID=MMETSP0228-20121227/7589_1 /TAXON_ID=133427 /ORGANISM="Protoceratium reticulatum, Strain CCCM 535 (=CCMP 1889)" /LENGTH=224 /DNA_ID=CAMNT_0008383961 /DNA_START=145 /DNA_END=819 /DNA_ORIENTATION=+
MHTHQVWGSKEISSSSQDELHSSSSQQERDSQSQAQVEWNSQSTNTAGSTTAGRSHGSTPCEAVDPQPEREGAALRAEVAGEAKESEAKESKAPAGEPGFIETSSLLPSPGSAKHGTGNCIPCHYFNSKAGCLNGSNCPFCHLHPKATRPCKSRRAKAKSDAGVLHAGFPNTDDREKVAAELVKRGPYMETVIKSKLKQMENERGQEDQAASSSSRKQKQVVAL